MTAESGAMLSAARAEGRLQLSHIFAAFGGGMSSIGLQDLPETPGKRKVPTIVTRWTYPKLPTVKAHPHSTRLQVGTARALALTEQ